MSEPQIHFDNTKNAYSTIMEVVAEDRPGLVQTISSEITRRGCTVELALTERRAANAVDVFYVTLRGAKLEQSQQQILEDALLDRLRARKAG